MPKMRIIIAAALLLWPLCTGAAPPDKIDEYVAAEMRRQHIPGLALGIYRRGEIVKAQGYGLANVELDVPAKAQTIFQSGSVGKQFTATAVMMLVEEGKVNLEDSITKYFDHAPLTWKPVKVKNLLSHTSGLAEYETAARTKPGAPFYLRLDYTEAELFDKIAKDCHTPRGLSARREVAVHQYQLRDPWHTHPESHGPILRRLPGATYLSAAGHERDARHQRS